MLVQGSVLALVAWFTVRTFIRHWHDFSEFQLSLWDQPLLLVAALALVWGAYGGLMWAWRTLVTGYGATLAPWTAARIWALSALGKYVPGKIWALAGMVVMARREGVPGGAAAGAAIIMQFVGLGSGAVVVASTGSLGGATDPTLKAAVWVLLGLTLAGGVVLLKPTWFRAVLDRIPGGSEVDLPSTRGVIAGTVANLVSWSAYGLAVWVLAKALVPGTPFPLLATVGAFAASYIVGFLVLFVPGGLGVREGIFVLALESTVGLAPATAIAVASRLLFTLTEIGIAVPFLLIPGGRSRGAS